MLLVQPKWNIVEKIVQDKNGRYFRAYFAVTIYEGNYFAKLLRSIPVDGNAQSDCPLLTSCDFSFDNFDVEKEVFAEELFSKDFNFCTSQRVRAPSFV